MRWPKGTFALKQIELVKQVQLALSCLRLCVCVCGGGGGGGYVLLLLSGLRWAQRVTP